MTSNVLYRSQAAASDAFQTNLLPCYSAEYAQSQGGMVWGYSKVYNTVDAVYSTAHLAGTVIYDIGSMTLGLVLRPVTNLVYPVNPINGDRHFVGVPRNVEKVLGDYVFYPLASYGKRSTNELLPGTNERIADKVDNVLDRLKTSNQELLNPKSAWAKFDYRTKTVHSTQVNAFACPAGGMVVFDQIVKEIDAAVKSQTIKNTTIQFADGSTATVDLTGVKTEDVLAALMGHEMTHVASRHSMVRLFGGLIRSIVLSIGRVVFIGHLQLGDKEYQDLRRKSPSQLTDSEKQALADKESYYDTLNSVLEFFEEQVKKFEGLFSSRKNEYEADVTGTYFAHQAKFNPLGAIYLQEVLGQQRDDFSDWMHKNLEFWYTHPYGENRKRAIFSAIGEINPKSLKGRTTWKLEKNERYDAKRSGAGLAFAHNFSEKLLKN